MRRSVPLLALAWALAACARQPSRPGPPLPASPAERLAAVRAREEQIRSLRARFSSVTHVGDSERRADGVLVVAKPDRFRLRLLLPFGMTVFDLLHVGDRTWLSLPLGGGPRDGDGFAIFSRDDLGAAFLRGAYAFPGTCTAAAAGNDEVAVQCAVDGVTRRTLRIAPGGIVEETSYDAGVAHMQIRYADYREVRGIAVPFRITLEYPQRRQSVAIAIDDYEVNPALPDAAFLPPPDTAPRRG